MFLKVAVREVRERWWAILGAALLTSLVVVGAGSHLQHKQQWTATTTLIVAPSSSTSGDRESAASTLEIGQSLTTNPDVINSAGSKLHYSSAEVSRLAAKVSTVVVVSSQTLSIVVQARDAATAAAFTGALATAMIEHESAVNLSGYERQLSQANQQVANLNSSLSGLTQKLQTVLAALPPGVSPETVDIALRQKLATTNLQLKSAQERASVLSTDGPPGPEFEGLGQTLASGGSSLVPSSTSARAALGALLGMLLALIGLAVLALADARIRSRQAAEAAFGVPVLAEIPHMRRHERGLAVMAQSRTPAATAYQGLGASILELESRSGRHHQGRERKVIAIASADSAEGRSTVAANLASCATLLEHRVLVVDADLRSPDVADLLGVHTSTALPNEAGASSQRLGDVLQASKVPGLRVLALGGPAEHPLAIIPRVRRIAERLRSEADTVIVDTPPLLESPESLLLVGMADTVLVVCRWGRTTRAAAWLVAEQLARVGTDVAGVVLVDAPGSRHSVSRRHRAPMPVSRSLDLPEQSEEAVSREATFDIEHVRPGDGMARVGARARAENGSSTGGPRSTAPPADEITAS